MNRKVSALTATALVGVAAVVAGCGGSSTGSTNSTGAYGYGGAPKASAGAGAGAGAKIGTANTALGRVVADKKGDTLYLFEKDKGSMSSCYGACASQWPPVTVAGKPSAVGGVPAGKLGTTKRNDGKLEVTYNGHPLYRYTGDMKRGDTNGEGLNAYGAKWYVLAPSGNKIDRD